MTTELIVKKNDVLQYFGDELSLMNSLTTVTVTPDMFGNLRTHWTYPKRINLPETFLVTITLENIVLSDLNDDEYVGKIKGKKETKEDREIARINKNDGMERIKPYTLLYQIFTEVGQRKRTLQQLCTAEHLLSTKEENLTFSQSSWIKNPIKDFHLHRLIFTFM